MKSKTSKCNGNEMLYLWEFALLRDNGTVAFLRPHQNSTDVEYYEGLLTDDVPEEAARQWRLTTGGIEPRLQLFTHDQVPTFAIVHDLEESAQYNQAGVEFPSTALLTYTSPQNLHFLPYKKQYNALRGSATRPPQRVGR